MTFKTEIFDIARAVAVQNLDWTFSSGGHFVNKSLKYTELIVSPGFTFNNAPSCVVQPFAAIKNKMVVRLCKEVIGRDPFWTLSIKHQLESDRYRGPNSVQHIYPDRTAVPSTRGEPSIWPTSFITKEEVPEYLQSMLNDGIVFIKKYFNLESEDALLRHLPVSFQWMDKGVGNTGEMGSFYEGMDGVTHCLAAIVLGNFEFVERYCSEEFKTRTPKRKQDLEKIVAALPELKRRFAETGKVV